MDYDSPLLHLSRVMAPFCYPNILLNLGLATTHRRFFSKIFGPISPSTSSLRYLVSGLKRCCCQRLPFADEDPGEIRWKAGWMVGCHLWKLPWDLSFLEGDWWKVGRFKGYSAVNPPIGYQLLLTRYTFWGVVFVLWNTGEDMDSSIRHKVMSRIRFSR